MKHALLAIVLLSILSLSVVAQELNGDPDYDYIVSQLGYLDRVALQSKPLTVVNGALCSAHADLSGEFTGKTSYSRASAHIGEAVQLFKTTASGWEYLGEKQIKSLGEPATWTGLDSKATYHYDVYFCDVLSRTCTDYTSTCSDGTRTLRSRYCSDTGKESTIVSWADAKAPSCTTPLGGETKVTIDEPDDPKETVQAGQTSTGDILTSDGLKGTFTNVVTPSNVKGGEVFKVTATFKADTAGQYYIEAGMLDQPLAIVSGSKCDGSKNWAGDYFDLTAGQEIPIDFNIVALKASGEYPIVVGAYTACLNAGGRVVTRVQDNSVNVIGDNTGFSLVSDADASVSRLAIMVGIIFVFAGVVAFFMGAVPIGVFIMVMGVLMALVGWLW